MKVADSGLKVSSQLQEWWKSVVSYQVALIKVEEEVY